MINLTYLPERIFALTSVVQVSRKNRTRVRYDVKKNECLYLHSKSNFKTAEIVATKKGSKMVVT